MEFMRKRVSNVTLWTIRAGKHAVLIGYLLDELICSDKCNGLSEPEPNVKH
jgi:hypothetical protein